MVVESQARLITSNSVLLQVIQDTGLDKDPEFGGGNAKGALASLLGLFGIEIKSAGDAKPGQMAALETLIRHINVKKTDRTFIVDIDVWSNDPAKAAMLANAISRAYLAESKNSQATAARRATTDLSGRLKELQERLRNAENTLATYKAQNNFVGTQDTMISDQQLSASNQRLAAARALALDAQAKYDQIEASRRALDRRRRHSRGAAVSDHRQSARAICRGAQAPGRTDQRIGTAASGASPGRTAGQRSQAQYQRGNRSFRAVGQERPDPRPRLRILAEQGAGDPEAPERAAQPGFGAAARTRARGGSQPRRLSILPQALARNRGAGKPQHLERPHHRRSHRAAAAHLPAGHEHDRDPRLHARRGRGFGLDHRGQPAVARDQRTAAGAFRAQQTGKHRRRLQSRSPPSSPGSSKTGEPRCRGREATDRAPAGIRRGADARRHPQPSAAFPTRRGWAGRRCARAFPRPPSSTPCATSRDRGAAFARRRCR